MIAGDAVGWISKLDSVVRLRHNAIPRNQLLLALVVIGHHGNAAVMLGAGHAACPLFETDQSALAVSHIAVGLVQGLTEQRGTAGGLVVAQQKVVGNVAEDNPVHIAEIDRTLGPVGAGPQATDRRGANDQFFEPQVECLRRLRLRRGACPLR